ncbi:MAG TPA: hypothetical protein VE866_10025, partial [Candidatus Binatia bacterium]|nr:hypothetical protein [Candidatus Binatia bacterium]
QQPQNAGDGKTGANQKQATNGPRTQTRPPASVSTDQVVEKLNAKKAAAIEALGQALYDDVVANAKRTLNPAMSATNKAYSIAQTLDATIELLNETRTLAGELPSGEVDQVMDTYHVTTFSEIPNFAALEKVSLALKTVADNVSAFA